MQEVVGKAQGSSSSRTQMPMSMEGFLKEATQELNLNGEK
jgi:hypothetical protein